MKKFDHSVRVNIAENKIVIHRIFEDGHKHLYTEMTIPSDKAMLNKFCQQLGENLLIDTPDGRSILNLDD